MAIPIVFNITPNIGPTGGDNLIEIYGDNFVLPQVAWATPGVTPEASPTVQVLFDAASALRADVVRTNRILVRPPSSPILPVVVRMTGNPAVTFAATGKTATRSTGNWLSDGFRAGQTIRVAKSTTNSHVFHILDITSSVLTFEATDTVVNEGPVSNLIIESREYGEGFVDVTIRNLDANGDPVPGELVTVENGYQYRRVQTGIESDLTRVVRQLIRELRKQVVPNVGLTSHTEFDPETGDLLNLTSIAEIPGISLSGPELTENFFYSQRGYQTAVEDGVSYLRQPCKTYDLGFDLMCVSDSLPELINLEALLVQWSRRNPWLTVDRDGEDTSLGSVSYEMELEFGAPLQVNLAANESNIRAFTGAIVIRGVDIEDMTGFNDLRLDVINEVTDIVTQSEQTGESYEIGPSPRSP